MLIKTFSFWQKCHVSPEKHKRRKGQKEVKGGKNGIIMNYNLLVRFCVMTWSCLNSYLGICIYSHHAALSVRVGTGWAWSTTAKVTAAAMKRQWEAWWLLLCRRPSIDTTGPCAADRSWSDTSSELVFTAHAHSTVACCWKTLCFRKNYIV